MQRTLLFLLFTCQAVLCLSIVCIYACLSPQAWQVISLLIEFYVKNAVGRIYQVKKTNLKRNLSLNHWL